MRRLKTTFRRSKTPTGADMKTQSSLEVPKQVRSASFDEIQLEVQRQSMPRLPGSQAAPSSSTLLKVPQMDTRRSRSFDSAGGDDCNTYLEVPRRFPRRRSSGGKTPPPCIHCFYLEIWRRQLAAGYTEQTSQDSDSRALNTDTTSSDDYDNDDDGISPPPPSPSISPNITVTFSPTCKEITSPLFEGRPPLPLSPTSPGLSVFPPSPTIELPPDEQPAPSPRRRSISRQEAFFVEPTGNSLENVSGSETTEAEVEIEVPGTPGLLVRDIYLTVPDLKRDRAASVDSCFTKVSSGGKTEELQPAEGGLLAVPSSGLRSRSVDIVLPTSEQARYKALALAAPGPSPTVPVLSVNLVPPPTLGKTGPRELRCTPDWSEAALAGDHLWSPTSVSGDCCYVGDQDCTRHGSRMKCSACKIIAHSSCIDILMDRLKFLCKPTFRDVGVRQYREETITHHHWVHRRSEKGKCRQCCKALQAKLSFSSKDIVALSCSWCKAAYHNKEACFNMQRIGEECHLGSQQRIIVPPSWIVKLPRKGSFKSSLRKSPKKKSGSKKQARDSKSGQKTFVIKPIPTSNITPVLVFINPKSGGNQGAKLLQKFQWLLNPRQVFDLTQGGPGPGLELFRKVPNLRVLACGGDGTVGWVLSVLDNIGFQPAPAVGVLPLGTGNDLARALGWGGGYEDEPISKILANIGDSDTVLLDRWELKVEPNSGVTDSEQPGKPNLPLNVVNNYFSFGVDAHIALEFHEAREAHPEKFNSRIRNKLFYGTAGGKDLMQRKWKGLAELVTLECDGKDMTHKLKEHKVHAIVFLNIPRQIERYHLVQRNALAHITIRDTDGASSVTYCTRNTGTVIMRWGNPKPVAIVSYGGGTHPWNKSGGTSEPSTEDGLIEVVGLTTYQLPLLQAGGHGSCITQCRTARIVTSKTIPMQVDGEACKLAPSIITLSRLNQATMLAKKKPGRVNVQQTTLEALKLSIHLITMSDYEQHHYNKDLLKQAAECIGNIEVNASADLEQVRGIINGLTKDNPNLPSLSPDWCFVDSCTAERFFRVDRAQENLHYVSDIGHECLFILDTGVTLLTPETETVTTGPSESFSGPMSFDTTTGQSISLDISHSIDTPSAGVSLDVPDQSHSSESGFTSPAKCSELLSPTTPQSPKPLLLPAVPEVEHDVGLTPPEPKSLDSSPETPIRTTKEDFLLRDTISNFKSSLLEKTSDAILKAAKLGDLKMLKDLHAAGYSLLSIDATGQTALHIGARYGHKDIVKYLIASAPSSIINMQDNDKGQTALHKAAAHKRHAVCCLLVAGGASLLFQDYKGLTPRQTALMANDLHLATYFESQESFQLASEDLETAV